MVVVTTCSTGRLIVLDVGTPVVIINHIENMIVSCIVHGGVHLLFVACIVDGGANLLVAVTTVVVRVGACEGFKCHKVREQYLLECNLSDLMR